MTLVLIKNNVILNEVLENGWATLSESMKVSPAKDGWTDGTYRLAKILPADPVPEGKIIISTKIELVNGEPKYVHTLSDKPAPTVPDRVTANQFGKQLAVLGILEQVQAWIATQSAAVQWSFNRSATFVRDDPMMQAGFTELGFTKEQIDAFFIAADLL